jgi:hypothetical protein
MERRKSAVLIAVLVVTGVLMGRGIILGNLVEFLWGVIFGGGGIILFFKWLPEKVSTSNRIWEDAD